MTRTTLTVPEGGYLAEFATADALLAALARLRADGYTALEWYAPYPVREPQPEGIRVRSPLPRVIFVAGLLGGIASYAIKWYANVKSYPLNIGGRPIHAVPAFIVSTFEGTVLCAALAAFVGVLWVMGLPRLWWPEFEVDGFERVAIDRYWVRVAAADPHCRADATPDELRAAGALRVESLGEAP